MKTNMLNTDKSLVAYGKYLEQAIPSDEIIAIPYKPGDIVEVGSAPFVPRYKILITEVGDNYDCCCVQGMRISKDGQCITGSL